MRTQKEYHYIYYSYEEWGRGYIGSRSCDCLPEEDVNYFGSFADKTFKPTQKIILKDDYETREEADADEIILHNYFEVDVNSHFANRARQTSTKFRLPRERSVEIGKKYGILSYEKNKELGLGIFGLTPEQRVENGKKLKELGIGFHSSTKEERIEFSKKGGNKVKELGLGIHALMPEQRTENGKKGGSIGGKVQYENKIGIHGLPFEERSRRSREIGLRNKENKTGICGRSEEKMREDGKKGGKKAAETNKKNGTCFWDTNLQSNLGKRGAKKTNAQKWMCLETGFITNPGNLTQYQIARGIDTSKRIRLS